ncbi:MAG TPA: hypothetical protein DEH00_01885, partial [Candidatus Marinimicrobia bacterium]|nr:hypothetical protein [Candidatus Neomarinimicrobiota bacterium]
MAVFLKKDLCTMMNPDTKSRLYETLAFLLILVFLLIHESGFNTAILRSPAILFSAGLFILLRYVFENHKRVDFSLYIDTVVFLMLVWAGVALIHILFLQSGKGVLKQSLFIFLPLTGLLLNTGRLVHPSRLHRIYGLSIIIFLAGIYQRSGPMIFFRIDPVQLMTLFVDQYLVSLFFLFLYFFLPPLILYIGHGLLESNNVKPFLDFVKGLLPFQSVLYFSHAALIVARSSESNRYTLSHYQILIVLFLLIMFFGGILLYKPAYKKFGKRRNKPDMLDIHTFMLVGNYNTGVSYIGLLLTLIGSLWVFNSLPDKMLGGVWVCFSGLYVYNTFQKKD